MTDEQINIAIAESLGFMRDKIADCWRKDGACFFIEDPHHLRQLPNYTADLNACHEFEKKLSLKDRNVYTSWLYESSLNLGLATWESAHATARQRCEAYLRTIGE